MPGTIIVTVQPVRGEWWVPLLIVETLICLGFLYKVLELKEVQSPSATISTSAHEAFGKVLVKVAYGKRTYKTEPHAVQGSKRDIACESSDFTFPVLNLRDNLRVSVLDCEENEIGVTDIGSHSIIEKGIWDDLFPLEGGGMVHLKLQFTLSNGERQRIQAMRESALRKKELPIQNAVPEISNLDVDSSMPITPQMLVSQAPLPFNESVIPVIQVPSYLDNKKKEDSYTVDASSDTEPICSVSETLDEKKIESSMVDLSAVVDPFCPVPETLDKKQTEYKSRIDVSAIAESICPVPEILDKKKTEYSSSIDVSATVEPVASVPKTLDKKQTEDNYRIDVSSDAEPLPDMDKSHLVKPEVSPKSNLKKVKLMIQAFETTAVMEPKRVKRSTSETQFRVQASGQYTRSAGSFKDELSMIKKFSGTSVVSSPEIVPEQVLQLGLEDHGGDLPIVHNDKADPIEIRAWSSKECSTSTGKSKPFNNLENVTERYVLDIQTNARPVYGKETVRSFGDGQEHDIPYVPEDRYQEVRELHSVSSSSFQSTASSNHETTDRRQQLKDFEDLESLLPCEMSTNYQESLVDQFQHDNARLECLATCIMCKESHVCGEMMVSFIALMQDVIIDEPHDPDSDDTKNAISQIKPKSDHLSNPLDLLARFLKQAIIVAAIFSCGTVLYNISRKPRTKQQCKRSSGDRS